MLMARGCVDVQLVLAMRSFADRVRVKPHCKVIVDLAGVEPLDASPLPGLLALQEVTAEVEGRLEVRVAGDAAAEMLANAGVRGILRTTGA